MRKKKCQRKHAKRRALERYGIEYNEEDLRLIRKLISEGKSKSTKQSNRVRIHELEYMGENIKIVYDKIRKEIVSFLP